MSLNMINNSTEPTVIYAITNIEILSKKILGPQLHKLNNDHEHSAITCEYFSYINICKKIEWENFVSKIGWWLHLWHIWQNLIIDFVMVKVSIKYKIFKLHKFIHKL